MYSMMQLQYDPISAMTSKSCLSIGMMLDARGSKKVDLIRVGLCWASVKRSRFFQRKKEKLALIFEMAWTVSNIDITHDRYWSPIVFTLMDIVRIEAD